MIVDFEFYLYRVGSFNRFYAANKHSFSFQFTECFALRHDCRIVGSFVGTLGAAPRQIQVSGLPMILSPEEIDLLMQLNRICLLKMKDGKMSEEYKNKFQLYLEMNYQDQIEAFKVERQKEIHKMSDKIMEGKRRKKSDDEIEVIDKETILKAEMSKISTLPRSQALVQTFSAQPWTNHENQEEIDWTYPDKNNLKNLVFQDLWHKDFYITDGSKFGADFLVYPGDPIQFHAKFIVICCEEDPKQIEEKDLVAKSRLGTNVKKIVLLATHKGGKIKYTTVNWNR